MNKKLKITLLSSIILSLGVSLSCVPIAFQGLPTILGQTPSPNSRADLCNLLTSVGGNADDVARCLTATSFEQSDIDRLCALDANLTAAQRETVISDLTGLGVNVQDNCPIAKTGVGSPSPTATSNPTTPTVAPSTVAPTATTVPEPTSTASTAPTIAPTPSNAPIPDTPTGTPSSIPTSHSVSDNGSGVIGDGGQS